jgi:hypothetical protein
MEQIMIIYSGLDKYNKAIIDHAENYTADQLETIQKIQEEEGRPEVAIIRIPKNNENRFNIIPTQGLTQTKYYLIDGITKRTYGPYQEMTSACLKQMEISAWEEV